VKRNNFCYHTIEKGRMRALLQRVANASVSVDNQVVGQIDQGMLVLLGIGTGDGVAEATLLAEKTAHMRIFSDSEGRFQFSLLDVQGAALVVSQFTLYADLRRGRRPGFAPAAPPDEAAPLVEAYVAALRSLGIAQVETGVFGAMMQVALTNDGPVTILVDSDVFQQPRRA
jgi:D-tyrosyl-tRNA(Tyr) deacylase